ncbi:pyridoxamine 5'-phosphate oxidase family protein [Mycolicibacterium hodleri]|uniref:Pyridoxamine 5'-phosphate oxidase family protein n=1 Tax=Mycolicibacterium hodleri TaxID=49897 RepID=A0A502E8E8_9MYCO|nr:pyridoxamine 5'-phosphate oxidase family protein [Mycolicibacterium hodleri]TPG32730.1 pyridoxamine 5'-phosphate oxidase family protein [Mycolicibacterium hodleri]
MTTFDSDPILELTEYEAWAKLASVTLGRLATSVAGQPEIFPVNFVVQRHTIVLRTAEGTKLLSALINQCVAFEADDHDVYEGWSVIVKGQARVLDDATDIAEAERAQVMPWIPTVKRRFLRITPSAISGRRFRFGGEPDDWSDPS